MKKSLFPSALTLAWSVAGLLFFAFLCSTLTLQVSMLLTLAWFVTLPILTFLSKQLVKYEDWKNK